MNGLNLQEYLDVIVSKAVSIPDIVLVKKKYVKSQRIWKLQHLDKEVEMVANKKDAKKEEDDYDIVLGMIAEDKDIRKKINLFKDDEAINELVGKLGELNVDKHNDSDIDIKIEDLLDNMEINDTCERKGSIDVIKEKESNEIKENKKQIGKRERDGKQIEDGL
jgi:hypothetical protein